MKNKTKKTARQSASEKSAGDKPGKKSLSQKIKVARLEKKVEDHTLHEGYVLPGEEDPEKDHPV